VRTVLIISVHPDDETLGCGGTLLRHRADGDTLSWVVVTDAHEPAWPREVIVKKADEVRRVSESYGMASCEKLGFPSTGLDRIPQSALMDALRRAIDRVKPEVVYLVHRGDVHSDHRAAFDAALAVMKPFHMASLGVRRVLSYETLSSTEASAPSRDAFVPTVFCDVTPYLTRKLEIMAMYESETQPDPMPRGPSAIRALARLRGATIGVESAEAFVLVRERI
jgi:LmbE family N-acetylglucosaminyl deacetylase